MPAGTPSASTHKRPSSHASPPNGHMPPAPTFSFSVSIPAGTQMPFPGGVVVVVRHTFPSGHVESSPAVQLSKTTLPVLQPRKTAANRVNPKTAGPKVTCFDTFAFFSNSISSSSRRKISCVRALAHCPLGLGATRSLFTRFWVIHATPLFHRGPFKAMNVRPL